MGSHASVLTPTQRWQVIAYVRQLSNGNVDCDGSVVVSTDSVSMASDVTAEDVQSEVSDSTKNEEVH